MNANNKSSSKIITVFSSSSATGKTITAINLAQTLYQELYNVCVVDLDLQFNDVCRYLRKNPVQSIYDYGEEDAERVRITEYVMHHEDCFDILAAPQKLEEAYNVSSKTVTDALDDLRNYYDYIIVDTTTGFGDATLATISRTDELIFMGIVDFIPTIKNMNLALQTLGDIKFPADKIKIVLNRDKAKSEIASDDVEKLLGRDFFHTIPNDFPTCIASIKSGRPIVLNSPQTNIAHSLKALTYKLFATGSKSKGEGLMRILNKLW